MFMFKYRLCDDSLSELSIPQDAILGHFYLLKNMA
jgi:hypothetical protein